MQDKNDPAFTEVGSLFQSMYAFMQKNGLQLTLAEDGSEKWLKGIKPGKVWRNFYFLRRRYHYRLCAWEHQACT